MKKILLLCLFACFTLCSFASKENSNLVRIKKVLQHNENVQIVTIGFIDACGNCIEYTFNCETEEEWTSLWETCATLDWIFKHGVCGDEIEIPH